MGTRIYALAITGLIAAAPLSAADFSDPTWPCIQRKVERLSLGLMWPMPVERDALEPALSAPVERLAATLSLRRVDLEDARARAEAFVAQTGADRDAAGQVFARVFDTLSTRRAEIMAGIAEYSLGQIALTERIDAARAEMDAEMAKDDPDFDRVDALEERIAWDERIYQDRQSALQYVCETPTLLEKRLYAVAQLLQEVTAQDG